MRESCSCGAGIQSLSYKRVMVWRYTHQHHAGDDVTELLSDTGVPIGFTIDQEDEDGY